MQVDALAGSRDALRELRVGKASLGARLPPSHSIVEDGRQVQRDVQVVDVPRGPRQLVLQSPRQRIAALRLAQEAARRAPSRLRPALARPAGSARRPCAQTECWRRLETPSRPSAGPAP